MTPAIDIVRNMRRSPLILGFDPFFKELERFFSLKTVSYPPYNVRKDEEARPIPGTGSLKEVDVYTITMAVAGFDKNQIKVTLEDDYLVIRGTNHNEGCEDSGTIYRGIAERSFIQSFRLQNGFEVESVRLKDGMLNIIVIFNKPQVDSPKAMNVVELPIQIA